MNVQKHHTATQQREPSSTLSPPLSLALSVSLSTQILRRITQLLSQTMRTLRAHRTMARRKFTARPSPRASRDQTTSSSDRSLRTFLPESHTDIVRRQGGRISIPRKLPETPLVSNLNRQDQRRLTRLLLNVTIERSLGPVQVVLAMDDCVRDLIKASVEVYAKERRRPLLNECNPRCFELHYSPFSLESLRPEEKLMNLGSRNFFLCTKRPASAAANSCCSEEAKYQTTTAPITMTTLMDFLL